MTQTARKPTETTRQDLVVAGLNDALLDSYALMLTTQVYHWNVEGPQFYSLHEAFEAQYRDLIEAVDALAERIRALGAYAPASAPAYLERASLRLQDSPVSAQRMVEQLIAGHEAIATTLRSLIEAAGAAGDDVTADLATQRLDKHAQTLWMLRSVLG